MAAAAGRPAPAGGTPSWSADVFSIDCGRRGPAKLVPATSLRRFELSFDELVLEPL